MTAATVLWTPPDGMTATVVAQWRAFYRRIASQYGLSPADYRALYLAQAGRCYICRVAKGIHPDDPRARGGRRLAVDHNHLLGNRREAVRGLLCSGSLSADTCNRLIARYKPAALARAASYLNAPPAVTVLAALDAQVADAAKIGIQLNPSDLDALAKAALGLDAA
jgi:hypothetical protein